jgi:hypothetical protein
VIAADFCYRGNVNRLYNMAAELREFRSLVPKLKETDNVIERLNNRIVALEAAITWIMRTHVKDGAIIDSRHTDTINYAIANCRTAERVLNERTTVRRHDK